MNILKKIKLHRHRSKKITCNKVEAESYSYSVEHQRVYKWNIMKITSHIECAIVDDITFDSPEFSTGAKIKDSWHLRLKIHRLEKENISEFLDIAETQILISLYPRNGGRKVRTKYRLYLLNNERNKALPYFNDVNSQYASQLTNEIVIDTCIGEMEIDACRLLNRKDEFLQDDILTICVDLTVYDDPMTIANPINSLQGSGRKLADDFRDLLATKTKSDIVIIVDNKKFDAHKVILIARSNFFKAMFSHDMKENTENEVTIPDIDPKVFEKLLEFIYTDQISDLDNFAKDLLEASDKYQLQGLKETCEISLAKTLNTENAIRVLILADRYNATQLKEIVMTHIYINFTEIKNTEDYKALGKYHPSLAVALLQKFVDGIDIK